MKKKTAYITFVTTKEVQEALDKAAKKQERSKSWIIERALKDYMVASGILKKSFSAD